MINLINLGRLGQPTSGEAEERRLAPWRITFRVDWPTLAFAGASGPRASLDVLHRESFDRLAAKFDVPAQDDEGLNWDSARPSS
jgi:hypothetical protein